MTGPFLRIGKRPKVIGALDAPIDYPPFLKHPMVRSHALQQRLDVLLRVRAII